MISKNLPFICPYSYQIASSLEEIEINCCRRYGAPKPCMTCEEAGWYARIYIKFWCRDFDTPTPIQSLETPSLKNLKNPTFPYPSDRGSDSTLSGVATEAFHAQESKTASKAASPICTFRFDMLASEFGSFQLASTDWFSCGTVKGASAKEYWRIFSLYSSHGFHMGEERSFQVSGTLLDIKLFQLAIESEFFLIPKWQ